MARRKAKLYRISSYGPAIAPDEEMIEHLKMLTEQARRCEIKAIGTFAISANDLISTKWCGGCASSHLMVTGATALQYRVTKAWVGGDG